MDTLELTEELLEDVQKSVDEREIILYNDDVNTFEHVINMLMKYCKHDALQAEQCAYIVHYKGKCGVKKGTFDKLRPVCEALLDNGLSAEIQ